MPSRSAVPGATAASASMSSALGRVTTAQCVLRPPTRRPRGDRACRVARIASTSVAARQRVAVAAPRPSECRPGASRMPCRGVGRRAGHDRPREAEPGRLGQAALGAVDLAQLAAQPDLAAGHEVGGQRTARGRRGDGQRHGQVDAGLDHPDPAGHRHVDLGAARGRARPGSAARPAPGTGGPRRPPGPCGAGLGVVPGTTSAWTSTSSGRWPSSTGATTEPGTPIWRSARNRALGSGTPTRPASPISNRPSSWVLPNRCLTARSMRRAWWRSPSKASTVSTRCSSTRGPARPPSLVTWPTSTTLTSRALGLGHQAVGAPPDLAHRARRRRQLGVVDGLDGVDDHHVGRQGVDVGDDVGQRPSRPPATATATRPPAARPAAPPAVPTPRPSRRGTWRRRRRWRPAPAAAGWTCRRPARRPAR